jgi:hypothetical protein
VHPTDANVVYIAAVNGGIWRTANAMAASPHWEQLTDRQESLSFGALEFDPTDDTLQTLVAGTGRFGSLRRMGGALVGLLRTTDGGTNWTALDGGGSLRTLHITGVASRGSTIVIAANNDGIRRSADTGATWTKISGAAGTNLPVGISFDLAGDPSNPARLFTHAGASGIFRSVNTGATWTKVSNAAIDALLGGANNVKISIGTENNVYVAIANNSRLAGLFRSGDGGGSWASLDLPRTPGPNLPRLEFSQNQRARPLGKLRPKSRYVGYARPRGSSRLRHRVKILPPQRRILRRDFPPEKPLTC